MAKILIADNEPSALQVMKQLLEADGHEVSEVRTGSYALRMVMMVTFDLVILSCEMPDVNSFDVLRALRVLPTTPKVLMVSQAEIPHDTQVSFDAWGVPYLQKPYAEQSVKSLVRLLLDGRSVPEGR